MTTEQSHIPPEKRTELYLKELEKRMDAIYQLSDKLATLASGALAITVTFTQGAASTYGCAVWFLRASWFGFIATVAGFFLIHHTKIWMHKDLADKIKVQDDLFITSRPPRYFHIGRYLLIVGFWIGLLSLALFGALTK